MSTTLSFIICGDFDPEGNMAPHVNPNLPAQHRAHLAGLDAIEGYMFNALGDFQCLDIPENEAARFLAQYGGDKDRLYRVTVQIQELDDVYQTTKKTA